MEPLNSNQFTLNPNDLSNSNISTNIEYDFSGQNASGTMLANTEMNYIKKEIQKDIHLPTNADLNTLESYLEDGYLYIECKLINKSPPLAKSILTTASSENFTFQNPLFDQKLNHTYSHDKYCTRRFKSNDGFLDKEAHVKHDKSVRFEENNANGSENSRKSRLDRRNRSTSATSDVQSNNVRGGHKSRSVESSVNKTTKSSNRAQAKNPIHDGFNCVTKDLLDNVYLTYFFKLPSCNPSDRTTCKIENHNVLKLKIIQERKCKLKKKNKSMGDEYESTEESYSTSTSTQSVEELQGEKLQNKANRNGEDNDENIFCLNSSSLDSKNKIMLRSFSRSCILPVNLFKFDETGLSVSFINNIWIRVEVPIIEFIEFSSDLVQHFNISNDNLTSHRDTKSTMNQNRKGSSNSHKQNGSIYSKRKVFNSN